MAHPTLQEEKKLWKMGYKYVACLDEVGRGSLAGPVVAAAVTVKNQKKPFKKIKDSKKLTPAKREEFYKILTKNLAIEWGIGMVSEKVIDKINILEATKLAMKRAVKNLNCKLQKLPKLSCQKFRDREIFGTINCKADFLILDGDFKINVNTSQKSIVKADEKVFSCAAASILAKVTRDRMMEKYHKKYFRYGFDKHKGYPTELHRKMLKKYGFCKIHRKTFRQIKKSLPEF